jgi:hypothetical protein
VSGTVTLAANAADNIGVAGVQFQVDGANVGGEDTTAPYSVSWNAAGATNGSHTITAIARDAAGNRTTSAGVVVSVSVNTADTTPPTVSVTSPAAGQTVTGTVNLSATASDNVGVAGVQFQVDGANVGAEATSAPYTASWNAAGATNGSHTITAIARDAAGNRRTSAGLTVSVSNSTPSTGTGGGTSRIVVNAYGSPSGGQYPIMELRLGTTLLTRWTVTGSAKNYYYKTSTPLTGVNLRVYFVNDAWDSVSDRNLFVNSLTLNGTIYPTTAPNVYSNSCQSGYSQSPGLYCNGNFDYPTSGPAGP